VFRTKIVRFTAGDLTEGLGFLDVAQRRATLFGLEQNLTVSEVIGMTRRVAMMLPLSDLSRSIVYETTPHIRLDLLFWTTDDSGVIRPLLTLGHDVEVAFAGMPWYQLQHHYHTMAWVDSEIEGEDFMRLAREEGLL
jgi:hypothetical protein